ncbi:hypothetical protein HRR83_000140 [Exophiala dermatitidis]|uniref:DH domain-containing protein n=2 Tax=Exophiala dermatitidis TaxID=5970 RepID=H6C8F3_EXODN|nr:uncharacterized protein HMPREF1120_08345 [Exophiala dermatitidis NIH/UT8656]KAJ4523494.1 hypothetical protein HRR73_002676 [Exophiala dermatitidis]EHY60380.1 hypothetical protein HMPREF1120_08345 [Exophiala dermatitidis NIH/UT8656]KAJ4524536.1 hypothetical protein HRR75_000125 [Exophiala dermatitidis]KAJ4527388.1 hypothetical protein HRR74_000141 [Exophiala dermatitidis]KAJ4530950.1 hypothetical protein HRR76_008638 [Exophiala dermatitidis]
MATQVLPYLVTSPFSGHFQANSNLHGSGSGCSGAPPNPSASLRPFFIHQDYQTSSSSVLSIAPTPNNENWHPQVASAEVIPSSRLATACLPKTSSRRAANRDGRLQSTGSSANLPFDSPIPSKSSGLNSTPKLSSTAVKARRLLIELPNEEKGTARLHTQARSPLSVQDRALTVLAGSTPLVVGKNQDRRTDQPVDGRRSCSNQLEYTSQQHCYKGLELPIHTSETLPEAVETFLPCHKQRHSTASSAFVHTMKTASLSNASFTVAPYSSRFARSTDSYGMFGSLGRLSTDSDRPATTSSIDEAAFRRGMKRRQILAELMATEESYVADLKALIYLYSTLLASTVTTSSRLRTSILRNVHDLLHLHESLLERLHQAAFQAAARKWADTVSCRHLGSPRQHRLWRSLGSNVAVRFSRDHRQTRSSVDSLDATRSRAYLGCADPGDVSDIAAIFKEFLNDFLVYEEYCANHSLIAHELQRQVPTMCSGYEAGIESLARSLTALARKHQNEKKGLTVGDLLIKPIQRMTKYPLLLDDLLKQTPAADCPSAHSEVRSTLLCLREVVQTVNHATDNFEARAQVQRRWSLQARLDYGRVTLKVEQFRALGNIRLCGVLHVTWQTRSRVDGSYALCILFDSSLVVALPAGASSRFEVVAFIHLSELKVESSSDGRGLQCHSALYTWKACFEINGHLHEFIFSACSSTEEEVWKRYMQITTVKRTTECLREIPGSIGLDLRSTGAVYSVQAPDLSRNPSVQRAATVGNRASICQVIIRNTHNPHDFHEFRQPTASAMNRSQSHLTSNRIVVLSPKRSERARLEATLSDVWTKDKLPFPGMIGSRGGQIIRASAGTLVRKLSLASIHAPFSRRSGSLSLSSRKSYDGLPESRRSRTKHSTPVFEVRKESLDECIPVRKKSHDVPELDTMDSLISRMIGNNHGTKRLSFSHTGNGITRSGTKSKRGQREVVSALRPDDPAEIFYAEEKGCEEKQEIVEDGLTGRKKRWSNPLGILRGLSAEGLRHMLYSSR